MKYISENRATWDIRTKEHIQSDFYDVDAFVMGQSSLQSIELAELAQWGEVSGKSLLHLQCHFGMDTLSFARLGAEVTGVDISSESIKQADLLAEKTSLNARFVCCDIYQTRQHIQDQFDIVYTSYGAIEWLPDIELWAKVVAASLKTGGILQMVEFHPYAYALNGDPYFYQPAPLQVLEKSYTENAKAVLPVNVWCHPISNIINALLRNGMALVHFNEYPYSPYNCFDGLEQRAAGKFYRKDKGNDVPLVFSIQAKKL